MKMVQEMASKRRQTVPAAINHDILRGSVVSQYPSNSSRSEEECVAKAFNNALSFKKIDCESNEELYSYGAMSTSILNGPALNKEASVFLGVKELELNGNCHSTLSIPVMSPLPSPAVLYDTRYSPSDKRTTIPSPRGFHFSFSPKNIRRPRRRTTRTNTTPVLGQAAKQCFLLSALSQRYSVESMTTSLIKGDVSEQGTMFMPTHTVLILGEISVGKSALCRQFFRSGMRTDAKVVTAKQNPDFCDEDEYREIQAEDSEMHGGIVHSSTHQVYERPVTVNDQCARIRLLDVNAEKHRMEHSGENYDDFEPYLITGDAYIVAYAITDRGTYKTAAEILSRMATNYSERMKSVPVILAGNKCDLVRRRQVSTAEAVKLAAKYDVKFIETSASLNQNVTKLFEGVIQQIRLYNTRNDVATSSTNAASSSSREQKDMITKDSDDADPSSNQQSRETPVLSDREHDFTPECTSSSVDSTRRSSDETESPGQKSCIMFEKVQTASGTTRYRKRASRCLMRILSRKEKSEQSRRSKSCQDLSVL